MIQQLGILPGTLGKGGPDDMGLLNAGVWIVVGGIEDIPFLVKDIQGVQAIGQIGGNHLIDIFCGDRKNNHAVQGRARVYAIAEDDPVKFICVFIPDRKYKICFTGFFIIVVPGFIREFIQIITVAG